MLTNLQADKINLKLLWEISKKSSPGNKLTVH